MRHCHLHVRGTAAYGTDHHDPAADHDDHATTDDHHGSTPDDNDDHGPGNDHYLTGDVDHCPVGLGAAWAPG